MEWTYSGKPANSTRDAVRFTVGDVDPEDKQLGDQEVEYLLSKNGDSILLASIEACNILAAKYARLVDKNFSDTSENLGTRYQHYLDLAKRLKSEMGSSPSSPATAFVGGLSEGGKEIYTQDDDIVQPAFTRGLHDDQADSNADEDG